jgi:2-oxoglutarate ferredoxin oxidoreductase subunit alpha
MGPGIGDLTPTQSSYRQATRGAGHGGYRSIVFCPGTVQEAFDMMFDAFDLAEKHSIISYIYADGLIGQVMEPVELRDPVDPETLPTPDWALTGMHGRDHANHVNSGTNAAIFERLNKEKYPGIEAELQRWKETNLEDCEYVVTGFGTVGRIAEVAVKRVAEATGKKIGFIRPLIAWPFPKKAFAKIPDSCKKVIVVEANNGQMMEDVELTLKGKFDVVFEPTYGSNMPTVDQVVEMLERQL